MGKRKIMALLVPGFIFGCILVVLHLLLLGLHYWIIASVQDALLGAFMPAERRSLIDLFALIQRVAPFFYLLFTALYLYVVGFFLSRRSDKTRSGYVTGWLIGIFYALLAIPLLFLLAEPITHAEWFRLTFNTPCTSPFRDDCGTDYYPKSDTILQTGMMVIIVETLLLSWLATGLAGWMKLRQSRSKA